MKTYSSAHVANFFLKKAEEEGRSLTQMKLMKLVYIGFGWVLALLGRDLFPERIEAWDHGPVIASLYHEFKHFGRNPINVPATEFDLDGREVHTPVLPDDEQDVKLVLEKVWHVYKNFSASDLRKKTHEENTPWRKAYKEGGRSTEIPHDIIREHFTRKMGEYLSD